MTVRRYQLRYLRYEPRPWIILDVEREQAVFTLTLRDKTFADRIIDRLNGEQIEQVAA